MFLIPSTLLQLDLLGPYIALSSTASLDLLVCQDEEVGMNKHGYTHVAYGSTTVQKVSGTTTKPSPHPL